MDEDTPHEVHWDEKQGSYVFSSGPFEGKRPLIKDGMILTPSTDSVVEGAGMSPSGGKEVVSDVTEVARPQTDTTPELPENKTRNIPEKPDTLHTCMS